MLDELPRGPVDLDEEAEAAPTDRKYWEEDKASKETLKLTDDMFSMVREFDPSVELKYNKFYIGLARSGRADNFVTFTPRKKLAGIEPRITRSDDVDAKIREAGFDLSYDNQWGRYRVSLDRETLEHQRSLIKELIGIAFQDANNP